MTEVHRTIFKNIPYFMHYLTYFTTEIILKQLFRSVMTDLPSLTI
jgi:CRISPR/Cas system-associated protein Csx1